MSTLSDLSIRVAPAVGRGSFEGIRLSVAGETGEGRTRPETRDGGSSGRKATITRPTVPREFTLGSVFFQGQSKQRWTVGSGANITSLMRHEEGREQIIPFFRLDVQD